jgi:hypothetical protein
MELICTPAAPATPHPAGYEATDLVDGLRSVLSGESLAARIPDYYDAILAKTMATRLREHQDFGYYGNAPDIGKLGDPYYDTVGDSKKELLYWQKARAANAMVREVFKPWMSPIDRIHIELDERLPHGLRLLHNTDGEPAFAGLARVFGDGAAALPHTDHLEVDAVPGRFSFTPTDQIGVNVYLDMPEEGGELAIWDWKPTADEYNRLRMPGSYGLDPARLPEPIVVITPAVGELILFSAHNVHAVLPSRRSPRVTISFFIVAAPNGAVFMYS